MGLVRQLINQVCYKRYHVSFYLWGIGPIIKLYKVLKYYGQDCSLAKYNKIFPRFLYFVAFSLV